VNLAENRKMRLEQAEQLMESSLTVAEWCRLNKVAESTMYHWMKVLREQNGGTPPVNRINWIEVDRDVAKGKVALAVRNGPAAGRAEGEPREFPPIRASANGVDIEVPHGASDDDIAAVMRAAMSL